MKFKITQRDIPSLEDGTYTIGSGLYLRKRGKYSNYFLRIQLDGRRKDIAIGSTQEFTLSVAKQTADRIRQQIRDGEYIKPKKAEKRTPTFGEFVHEAVKVLAASKHWKPVTLEQKQSIFDKYLLPTLKDAPIDKINRDDVLTTLGDLWYSMPVRAGKARALLHAVFSLAIVKGYRSDNPAQWEHNLEMFLPTIGKIHKVQHLKAMSFDDSAKMLLFSLQKAGYTSYRAIIFAILTARRITEIVNVRWDEIDFEAGTWLVPDERMKIHRGESRRVPLSTQLLELLKQWRKYSISDYVCPSYDKNRPIDRNSPSSIVRSFCKKFGIESGGTPHGFRSTFTDWAGENLEPVELVELSLDHVSGNQVRRAYFRTDLLEPRRALMQRYSDALFDAVKRLEGEMWRSENETAMKGD